MVFLSTYILFSAPLSLSYPAAIMQYNSGRNLLAKAENETLARLSKYILKKRRKQLGINQEQFSALMDWRATAVMA